MAKVSKATPAVGPINGTPNVAGMIGTDEQRTITAPLRSFPAASFVSRRCDVQQLTGRQRQTLKRLLRGLADSGKTLENGKAIRSESDALKWLLESLAPDVATVNP